MPAGSGSEAVRAHALEQLTWQWDHQLWPGLAGLTDDEIHHGAEMLLLRDLFRHR